MEASEREDGGQEWVYSEVAGEERGVNEDEDAGDDHGVHEAVGEVEEVEENEDDVGDGVEYGNVAGGIGQVQPTSGGYEPTARKAF